MRLVYRLKKLSSRHRGGASRYATHCVAKKVKISWKLYGLLYKWIIHYYIYYCINLIVFSIKDIYFFTNMFHM